METLRTTPRPTIAIATAVLLTVSLACGYWLLSSDTKEYGAWAVVSIVGSLIAAALLLRFVPATEEAGDSDNAPAQRGLWLSIGALVTMILFWTGLPIVLGVPALVLAAEGRARASSQGREAEATTAAIISGLAVVATVVLLVSGV